MIWLCYFVVQKYYFVYKQGPKQGRRARKEIEVDSGPAEDVHEDDTVAAADVPIARDVSKNVFILKLVTLFLTCC